MRVIAGKARRIQLVTVKGMKTRPTTDRIKETLFNMINSQLYDCRFLDLFSGSGGIGIEALSRGAQYACFVENEKDAANCIRENLVRTRLEAQSSLMITDAVVAIGQLESKKEQPFDFIFMDPPYNMLLERKALEELKSTNLVDENTIIIIEASKETDFEYVSELGFYIDKIKEYKTNKHVFISCK